MVHPLAQPIGVGENQIALPKGGLTKLCAVENPRCGTQARIFPKIKAGHSPQLGRWGSAWKLGQLLPPAAITAASQPSTVDGPSFFCA
jgi:hypothetical protein